MQLGVFSECNRVKVFLSSVGLKEKTCVTSWAMVIFISPSKIKQRANIFLLELTLLTLLHSERPKLYTNLAFLSAIGLREKTENGRVVFPESVIIHLKNVIHKADLYIQNVIKNFLAEWKTV